MVVSYFSPLYPLPSTLYPLPSTLSPLPSTLYLYTLYTRTLYPLPSTLYPLPFPLSLPSLPSLFFFLCRSLTWFVA